MFILNKIKSNKDIKSETDKKRDRKVNTVTKINLI